MTIVIIPIIGKILYNGVQRWLNCLGLFISPSEANRHGLSVDWNPSVVFPDKPLGFYPKVAFLRLDMTSLLSWSLVWVMAVLSGSGPGVKRLKLLRLGWRVETNYLVHSCLGLPHPMFCPHWLVHVSSHPLPVEIKVKLLRCVQERQEPQLYVSSVSVNTAPRVGNFK